MKRAFAFLALGAVLGSIALYLTRNDGRRIAADGERSGDPSGESSGTPRADGSAAGSSLHAELLDSISGPFGAGERAQVDALAARAGASQIEELARLVAALPNVGGRGYALDALLRRRARLDPAASVALARELRATNETLADLYRDWAAVDRDAALRAAGADGDAVFAMLTTETLGVEGALRAAELLPEDARIAAVARIAAIVVKADPYDALAQGVEILSDETRAAYIAAVFRDWAIRDPAAMLGYALDLGPEAQRAALDAGGIEAFAQLTTLRALEIVRGLEGSESAGERVVALMKAAREDPFAVMRYADSLPPGATRDQVLGIAAAGYAELDPEAALAWVQGLQPPMPGLLTTVMTGLARRSPERAIEILSAGTSETGPVYNSWQLMNALVSNDAVSAAHVAGLADRLAGAGRRNDLQSLASAWARERPRELLDWLLARGERAPAAVYSSAAAALGRTDPGAAAVYLQRIPQDLRPTWIKAAAEGYANADPPGAARWVEQYEGEEGYDEAVAAIARSAARRDPRAAARVLDRLDLETGGPAVAAARAIAAQWARHDARAARDWALDLPAGAPRDAALGPVLGAAAVESGRADRELLAAFSDDAAAQRSLRDAVSALAVRDPAAARRLADDITDPALRQEAERAIDRP